MRPHPPGCALAFAVWLGILAPRLAAQQYREPCTEAGARCSALPLTSPASSFKLRWAPPPQWKNPFDPRSASAAASEALLGTGERPAPVVTASQAPSTTAPTPTQSSQKKKRVYSTSPDAGSPGHIFWIVPAYKVNYAGKFQPLTPKEKFEEWAQGAYDPLGLAAGAVEAATLEYSSTDGFCGYGVGLTQYLQCFGSLQLDANDSSFFGDFVFTVWWHQDPRYFRLGKGGFGKRVLYSISRVFITYNDRGKNVFYSSALAGTALASVVSNAYYPSQDRGVGLTMSRIAIDLGNTALYNGSAEFWPDIDRWLDKHF